MIKYIALNTENVRAVLDGKRVLILTCGTEAPCEAGDILAVREEWAMTGQNDRKYAYRADGEPLPAGRPYWLVATIMPPAAVRLRLEVERVFRYKGGTWGVNFHLWSERKDRGAVGARIRAYRKALGMTQEELAKRAGITQSTVSSAEKGKHQLRETLTAIAGALSIDPECLTEPEASHENT